MRPVTVEITTDPEVIPLNTYGQTGVGVYATGGTISALADKRDVTTIIAAVAAGNILYPADGLLVVGGVGQTVVVSQYGD